MIVRNFSALGFGIVADFAPVRPGALIQVERSGSNLHVTVGPAYIVLSLLGRKEARRAWLELLDAGRQAFALRQAA